MREKLLRRAVRAFTLIELLVVVAIIGILASLLLPGLSRAKAAGRSAVCKSNLRQIGIGLNLYVEDREYYPGDIPSTAIALQGEVPEWFGTTGWVANRGLAQLSPYIGAGDIETDQFGQTTFTARKQSIIFCPARPSVTKQFVSLGGPGFSGLGLPRYGYGYNALGTLWRPPVEKPLGLGPMRVGSAIVRVKQANVIAPASMVAVADSKSELLGNIDPYGGPRPAVSLQAGHNNRANAAFCDGHVEAQRIAQWTEPAAPARARWNNDNQPHQETW